MDIFGYVVQICHMGGIFRKRGAGNQKLDPEQRDEIARLYSAGASLNNLSRTFGINKKSVRGLIVARGVPLRPHIQIPRRKRYFPKSATPVHERWATKQVELAIRRGDLKRPRKCSQCRRECRPHAHHDDYGKPLDVRWLCSRCHVHWHSKNVPVPSRRSDAIQE